MKRKNNYLIIIVMLLLSIGFAYLSTNLTINGRGLFGKSTWNIYFDNIKNYEGEEFVTVAPDTTTNNKELNFEVNLPKPGDSYKFFVDVVNDGDIDAMISVISKTNLDSDYAEYKVTYYDLVELEEKNLLKANSRDYLLVEVSYKKDIDLDTLRSDKDPINVTISLEYTQADKTAKEREKIPAAQLIDGDLFRIKMNFLSSYEPIELSNEKNFVNIYNKTDGTLYLYQNMYECRQYNYENKKYDYASKDICNNLISNYNEDYEYANTSKLSIKSINRVDYLPENAKGFFNNISTKESLYPIYMWYDDEEIKLYSKTPSKLYLAVNSSGMFSGMEELESIDLSIFDSSLVNDMSDMFNSLKNIKDLDFSGWDTSNVTTMYSMLRQCTSLTNLDLSMFDTSKVTNTNDMFLSCINLETLNLTGWNTNSLVEMYYMFAGLNSIQQLDISHFNLNKVVSSNCALSFNNSRNKTIIGTNPKFDSLFICEID